MPQLSKGNRRKVDLLLSMMSKDATQSTNASSTVSIGRPDQSPKVCTERQLFSTLLYETFNSTWCLYVNFLQKSSCQWPRTFENTNQIKETVDILISDILM